MRGARLTEMSCRPERIDRQVQTAGMPTRGKGEPLLGALLNRFKANKFLNNVQFHCVSLRVTFASKTTYEYGKTRPRKPIDLSSLVFEACLPGSDRHFANI